MQNSDNEAKRSRKNFSRKNEREPREVNGENAVH